MYDYLSIEIKKDPSELLNNPVLKFGVMIDEKTGEIIPDRYGYINRVADYKELKIYHFKNLVTGYESISLKGSIHKYYTSGINYNDFSIDDMQTAIKQLCNELHLQPEQMFIHGMEFGVNIDPGHLCNEVLNGFISYGSTPFELKNFNNKGYQKRFELSQYTVKIYNKGLHAGILGDLLRYEIPVKRMAYFHEKGIQIRTINDLLQSETVKQLRGVLSTSLKKLYYNDCRIDLDQAPVKEREILIQGSNTDFWKKLKEKYSATTYKKKVKLFRELVLQYSPNDLRGEIENKILNKWDKLTSYPILPNVLNEDSCPKLPLVQNTTVAQSYTHIVCNNGTPSKRQCVTCGRDITNQKKGSVFCSETIFGKQAKKCRNKVSNRKQHELKNKIQPKLFEVVTQHSFYAYMQTTINF